MELTFSINFKMTNLMRCLFLLLSMRPLRENCKRLGKIVYSSRDIILLYFINWLFFTAVGRILFQSFKDYYDQETYFIYNYTSFLKTFFTIHVLSTTGNYPDAMVRVLPDKWTFLFYLVSTFMTIFIIPSILTGALYFNYTQVTTKIIADNKENEDFKLIMKLCLSESVITKERVTEVIDLYHKSPEVLKYKAALANAKGGSMVDKIKYANLNADSNVHFTDALWWRILFAVIDGA